MSTNPFATLEATIVSDLKAGISWLEDEVATVGLAVWNVLKGAFIALEPAEANVLITVLTSAVAQAAAGHTIEEIETAALNLAKAEEQAVLLKAGSGIVQTLIAGIKANQ